MSAAPAAPSPIALIQALDTARHHHTQNQLLKAAEAYRQALRTDPRSQPALLGLSLIARQSYQLHSAVKMALAALAVGPGSAIAWTNYGDLLLAVQQILPAQSAFRRAIALDPSNAAAHYGLGNSFALRDEFAEALSSFQTAVHLNPRIPEFHFASGFCHGKLDQHREAVAAYRGTVTLRPGFASAWLNLGVELFADGRPQLAELCYRQALAVPVQTTQISAHLNLGHLARCHHHFEQAEQHYKRALHLTPASHPRHSEVQIAVTYLHLEQKQFLQAWQSLEAAEAADPTHQNAEVPNARGILLLAEHPAQQKCGVPRFSNLKPGAAELIEASLAAAIESFQQSESRGHKTAASNRANALLRLGRCKEALAAHQTAVNLAPYHPGARYNLSLTQLRLGDYAQGWRNYEVRWRFREVHPSPRRFHQPRWQGESLHPAKPAVRLFLYAEQGLGDTIQFIRYLPLVAQRLTGAHLIVEVHPPLARLLTPFAERLSGVTAEVIVRGNYLPDFTHHCPLMSLPAVFETSLETVPNTIPYLAPDPELAKARSRELTPNLPAIGLAWAGNPNYRADRERSTRLETFLPLLQLPDVHLVSLQKGEAANQISEIQPSLPENCTFRDGCSRDCDFADTAALMANLDLVITTDTAVAHLAGALGMPLWLLLPWQSDWRWMQSLPTTPWYPSARLFRQASPNNWPELIHRVARELSEIPKQIPQRQTPLL